ncbi:PucR family transcriptional regulator [Nakamurella aerolata]|uniref:Helix-turn-helix domain-containing protein n=1 Tax=Nakamurella aerolata TaxID=1656892 RepID=A0A849AAC0_9ACTN|nr:helix-turn-helix domain-containing protein [Nakamurella aerolata]NNG37485.1 helix-turn-helix domain-containing protein [Nakamurella aerolata]
MTADRGTLPGSHQHAPDGQPAAAEPAGDAAASRRRDIGPETLRRVERSASALATRAIAAMDARLSWFRALSAEQRSWVTLVAQAGIAGYVSWLDGSPTARLTEQVFGAAPRRLLRQVTFRRTVELVRLSISVADEHIPALGDSPAERAALADTLLRYSREIAFAAAGLYAAAAETRGAWDARIAAAIVDGLVRGQDPEELASHAAALSWDSTAPAVVLVGAAPPGDPQAAVDAVDEYSRAGRPALAGVHGTRLVVLLSSVPGSHGATDRGSAPDEQLLRLFGPGPVVIGPAAAGMAGAVHSATEALAGLAVVAARPDAPRLIAADALMAERVVAGDGAAAEQLRQLMAPLETAGSPLLPTLRSYLDHAGALEPAARTLFVHPNTMRYRLRRVAELTGLDPWDARDQFTLRIALVLGSLPAGAVQGS